MLQQFILCIAINHLQFPKSCHELKIQILIGKVITLLHFRYRSKDFPWILQHILQLANKVDSKNTENYVKYADNCQDRNCDEPPVGIESEEKHYDVEVK